MEIIYGTTNVAKLKSMQKALDSLGIVLLPLPKEKLSKITIQETGATPLENAQIKARAYFDCFHQPVFSCDSGLYFDEVKDEEQPKTKVRRVNGVDLTDEEMITYYSSLAKRYGGKLTARYKNAICFILDDSHIYSSMDLSLSSDPFFLVATPHQNRTPGFPLNSLSVEIKSGKYYYDIEKKENHSTIDDGFCHFFQKCLTQSSKQENK
jgi:XTP/dITP diphosphohydrolase